MARALNPVGSTGQNDLTDIRDHAMTLVGFAAFFALLFGGMAVGRRLWNTIRQTLMGFTSGGQSPIPSASEFDL